MQNGRTLAGEVLIVEDDEGKRARTTIVKPFDLFDVERELLACCGMDGTSR